MAVTKHALAEHLHDTIGLTKIEARELLDLMFEEIRQCLELGEPVKLSGFGNFELRDKKPRPGRNPKTGDPAQISARRVAVFRSGHKLVNHLSPE